MHIDSEQKKILLSLIEENQKYVLSHEATGQMHEEMGELAQAMNKVFTRGSSEHLNNLIEECVDVFLQLHEIVIMAEAHWDTIHSNDARKYGDFSNEWDRVMTKKIKKFGKRVERVRLEHDI